MGSTVNMIALDAFIQGDLGWRLSDNLIPRDQSDTIFCLNWSLRSISRPLVASVPPSDVTLDAGVQANYSGSAPIRSHLELRWIFWKSSFSGGGITAWLKALIIMTSLPMRKQKSHYLSFYTNLTKCSPNDKKWQKNIIRGITSLFTSVHFLNSLTDLFPSSSALLLKKEATTGDCNM